VKNSCVVKLHQSISVSQACCLVPAALIRHWLGDASISLIPYLATCHDCGPDIAYLETDFDDLLYMYSSLLFKFEHAAR